MKKYVNFIRNVFLTKIGIPNPFSAVFWVTDLCNSRCTMCNIWKTTEKNEMDLNTFEKIFKESKLLRRMNLVVFTGGEPFLKEDLPEFVAVVNKYASPLNISFATNGLLSEKIISILDAILEKKGTPVNVKISLDGIDEIHDKLRGREGSFNKSLETLSRMCELKLKYPKSFSVSLGFTATSINYHQMPLVMKLAERYGVDFFYKPVIYAEVLKNEEIEKSLFLSAEQIEFLKSQHPLIIDNLKKSNFRKKYLYGRYLNFLNNYYKKPGRYFPCYACLASFHVSANWDVFSCLKYSYVIGNLSNVSFDEIFNGQKASLVREKIKKGDCSCLCTGEIFPSMIVHDFPLFMKRRF